MLEAAARVDAHHQHLQQVAGQEQLVHVVVVLDFAEAEACPAFGPRLRCLASEPSVHLVEEEGRRAAR